MTHTLVVVVLCLVWCAWWWTSYWLW